jgi:drug/metabolite transporter (DMT)-like permease
MIDIPAVAAAASGTGYGLANFFGGLAARRQGVARVMLCSQTAALAIITAAASLLPGSPHAGDLLLGGVGGLVTAVGVGLAYRCFTVASIGLSAALLACAQLAVPAALAAATHDRRTPLLAAGLLAAAVAVAVLTWPTSTSHAGPQALLLAAAAGTAFSGYHALISTTSSHSGLWPVVAAETSIVATAATAVLLQRPRPWRFDGSGLAVADGLASTGATLSGLAAVRTLTLPAAGALIALLPATATALLSRIALRERLSRRQQTGLALAAAAILLLASHPH